MTITQCPNVKLSPALLVKVGAAVAADDKNVGITRQELLELLSGVDRKQETLVNVTIDTEPRLKGGKSNTLNGIRKLSSFTGHLGVYARHVERQADREHDVKGTQYTPDTPRGKEYVGNSPVMEATKTAGRYYLAIMPMPGSTPKIKYYSGNPTIEVATAMVEKQLYVAPGKNKQSRDTGIDRPIVYRTPRLDNIVQLSLGGFVFVVA